LTDQERRLVQRVKITDKWDGLWWKLSYLVPCMVIVGIGIWNDSGMVAITGLVIFLVFQGRSEFHQAKQFPVFKGLCERIESTTDANNASQCIVKTAESKNAEG
jgi:hypothetical protein